ncbi:MAG: hypothetical protein D6B27_02570 [Gammaproteobacteria bacterium]|nr:MAG: hypothetical protein D6B27_02570 [Gammaproteobacteria bacterium]
MQKKTEHPKNNSHITIVDIIIMTVVMSVFSASCSVSHSNNQNKTTIAPSTTPEETVKVLYSDAIFFNIRNSIHPETISHLAPCITPELKIHFESHNKNIEKWKQKHKDSELKLPVSEGPIFLSNYEGANSFKIGKAMIEGKLAKVPVSLSIKNSDGLYKWIDIALLKQVGGFWLLNNIIFQSGIDKNNTLLNRVLLSE